MADIKALLIKEKSLDDVVDWVNVIWFMGLFCFSGKGVARVSSS